MSRAHQTRLRGCLRVEEQPLGDRGNERPRIQMNSCRPPAQAVLGHTWLYGRMDALLRQPPAAVICLLDFVDSLPQLQLVKMSSLHSLRRHHQLPFFLELHIQQLGSGQCQALQDPVSGGGHC